MVRKHFRLDLELGVAEMGRFGWMMEFGMVRWREGMVSWASVDGVLLDFENGMENVGLEVNEGKRS